MDSTPMDPDDGEPGRDALDHAIAMAFGKPASRRSQPEREALPPLPERYEQATEIGRGGVGRVLRVRDRFLKRDLAIKILRPRHAADVAIAQRFLEEAQVIAQLQHPGIVPVHEVGLLAGGQPYFAMRLVEGESLAARLRARTAVDAGRTELVSVFARICETVAFAHSRGVVHRDLKPTNVMLGAFGEVLVLDWGMAKVRQAIPGADDPIATLRTDQPSGESVSGTVFGTPGYMAPEQARGEIGRIDERCDVFGLGAVLCEILTGTPACFDGEPDRLRQQAARGDFVAAHARLDACGADAALVQLAKDCLQAVRERRPRSAEELAARLARHRTDQMALARQAEIALARAAAERRARRLGGSLVLALLALALAGIWYQQDRLQRLARADLAAHDALAALEILQQRAERSGSVGDWNAALAAARQSGTTIASAATAAALAARLHATCAAIESRAEVAMADAAQRERDLGLQRRLIAIRAEAARDWNFQRTAAAYESALAEHGLVLSMPGESVAAAIRGSRIAADLLTGVDDLVLNRRRAHGEADPLASAWRAIADAIDPDRDRVRFRAADPADGEALRQLAQSVDVRTASPQAVLCLAGRLAVVGEADRARHLLLAAQLQHPDDFWVAFELAWCARRRTPPDHVEAIHWDTVCTALRPDSAAAHVNLGIALLESGQIERGIATLRRAIEIDPGNATAHYNLGQALYRRGDAAGSIAAYQAALALTPEDAALAYRVAFTLRQAGRRDESRATYEAAVARHPTDLRLGIGYGALLCDQFEDLEGAEAQFRRCLEVAPNAVPAMLNMTRIAGLRGDDEARRDWFERVLEVDPVQPDAHLGLAELAIAAERWGAAAGHAQRVLDRLPADPRAWHALGLATWGQGDLAAAAAAFERVLVASPNDPAKRRQLAEVLEDLGSFALQRGDLPAAAAAARRATEIQPSPAAFGRFGITLFELGQWDEARARLEQASADPGESAPAVRECRQRLAIVDRLRVAHAEPWSVPLPPAADENVGLARLCSASGRHAAAARCWAEALRLAPGLDRTHYRLAACAAVQAAAADATQAAALLARARAWLEHELAELQALATDPAAAAAAQRSAQALLQDARLAPLRQHDTEVGAGWVPFWGAVRTVAAAGSPAPSAR